MDGGAGGRDAERARSEASTRRLDAWRDVYEQAIALNDVELEEHHDGWKPVDKGAKRAAHHRRQASVEVDAEVVIGANHSRRASSVDFGIAEDVERGFRADASERECESTDVQHRFRAGVESTADFERGFRGRERRSEKFVGEVGRRRRGEFRTGGYRETRCD